MKEDLAIKKMFDVQRIVGAVFETSKNDLIKFQMETVVEAKE